MLLSNMSPTSRNAVLRILVPLLLFGSAFVVPVHRFGIDTSNFLTTVSVLFAILLGFFIATATTNYLNFQSSLAAEGTALIMLFNLGALVRPSAKEKLADAIDAYVIATLDFGLTDYVKNTEQEYAALVTYVDTLEPEDDGKRRVSALDALSQAKTDMLRARTAISFAAQRVTRATHWIVIVLLGVLLVALVFGFRDGTALPNIIAGTLVAVLYLILLLLYQLDGNVFLEEQLAYEDVQGIFRSIGRLVYYPAFAVEQKLVRAPKGTYRIGEYVDAPHSKKKVIRTVV